MIDLVGDAKKRMRAMLLFFCLGLLALAFAFASGAYSGEAHSFLEKPGGMIAFAFAGCWALIILAKLILTPLLQRDEDYYREGGDEEDV